MARVPLEIPKVGLVMENARLVRWLKSVGEMVKQGEPLLELETEKSVVEIESSGSGRLVEIMLQADQEVRVGDRVAWLDTDSDALAAEQTKAAAPEIAAPVGAARSQRDSGVADSPASVVKSNGAEVKTSGAESTQGLDGFGGLEIASGQEGIGGREIARGREGIGGRVKSSPVARRLAAEHSLDLRLVKATGPRGRVQLSDVRRAIEARHERSPRVSQSSEPQALSSMRRAVARSMTLSNATVPQFQVERAVDWTTLRGVRNKLLTELSAGTPRPSVNDFLLLAIARSLLTFPQLNATFIGDANSTEAALLPAAGTHIGLVVAVEQGLLVPVLHEVERSGIVELARRRNEIVQRALHGKLKREELEGATFSLSNLGARGPDRFTALVSPPQSAILAVGRQRDSVVAMNGGIHVRPLSTLTLTVDHRVADGRLAANFLASVVEILEGDAWG